MKPFHPLSTVDQLAAHLREEILTGGVDGGMPGVLRLKRELGVGSKTVVAALEVLKREGLLETAGKRRRSRVLGNESRKRQGLKVHILLYEKSQAHGELIVQLGHQLEQRGHRVVHAPKSLSELKFDVTRVAQMVEKTDADAWIVQAGSRPVLEWFSTREVPTFALFGRQSQLPIASLATVKAPAVAEALRKLVSLRHHRIVMLVREERRKPTPGFLERRILEEMTKLGIQTGPYNLPDWEETAEGLHHCLESLFRITPPTALLISESALFFSVQQFFSEKRITVPHDVSLVCMEDHPAFEWFHPQVSHVFNDTKRWVPRMVQWVENIAKGKEDTRETLFPGVFIEGGTIGPAKA